MAAFDQQRGRYAADFHHHGLVLSSVPLCDWSYVASVWPTYYKLQPEWKSSPMVMLVTIRCWHSEVNSEPVEQLPTYCALSRRGRHWWV